MQRGRVPMLIAWRGGDIYYLWLICLKLYTLWNCGNVQFAEQQSFHSVNTQLFAHSTEQW